MKNFEQSMYELIVRTSTHLPDDVTNALIAARVREEEGTRAALALKNIHENNQMAVSRISPICQDTGMPTFKIYVPISVNQIEMKQMIRQAIVRATKEAKLRPNTVNSLTGKNDGTNLGAGTPVIKIEQWANDFIEVKLILKGGGCENKNIQYSLPTDIEGLGRAGRDIDGIRKCLLHAVYQAQGQGCAPGFIGVGIGGDRTTGYELAKEQLFRSVSDTNENQVLSKLEQYIVEKTNTFGIGTMGFSGKETLLGCKIGVYDRIPASFFVSVAYNCWAFRRQGVKIDAINGAITEWLYQEKLAEDHFAQTETLVDENVIELTTPITEETIRSLKVGDVVSLKGRIYTGRDEIHKYLFEHETSDCPVDLNGAVMYHCGPVMAKDENDDWRMKACGPTTSIREEPYQAEVMKRYGIRVAMGKGGMGEKTLAGLKEFGGVYLNAIGGAAQYYAGTVKKVEGVDFLENFGMPEALWHLHVDGFKAVVTMDAHGGSLHADVEQASFERLSLLAERVFE